MSAVQYTVDKAISPAELLAFYQAQRHTAPESPEKLVEMVGKSDCFVTARDDQGRLIGVARGLADGVRGYLAECKLDPGFQGPAAVTRMDGRVEHDEHGIAREMAVRVLARLREMGCRRVDVVAYGTEEDFCEELGFKRNSGAVAMSLDTAAMA